ncbi:MAG: PDZ domain-containing protein [Myxococcota bacterium]|nr:PDZ domain-containing protein [Myxococcota bacterium]
MFARSRGMVLGLVLAACSPSPSSDLLVVSVVGPVRLDDGSTLTVLGEGFPLGRAGTLVLRGTHQRPGEAPCAVEETLAVRVTSADRAEHAIDATTLAALGGRGTFVGRAELAFDAAQGGRVLGRVETTLDLGGASSVDAEASTAFLERLGASLDEELPIEGGVVLSEVRAGGLAASHGLAEGDRIVAIGQLRVRDPNELRPPRGAESIVLHVARPGLEGTREVVLSGRAPTSHGDPIVAILLALFAAVVVLFGPGGRALASLRRPGVELVPVLVTASAAAALVAFLHLDLTWVAAFVALPVLVDAWITHRLRALPAALFALGAALVVGTFVHVDGGASATVALRHPLALVGALAAALALGSLRTHDVPSRAPTTRPLVALAQGVGAVWLASLFAGSPWLGLPLAIAIVALPRVPSARIATLALVAGAGALALAFATDLSRPVPLTPEEPRVAWLIGAALAALALVVRRRDPERRAHVFL